MLFSKQLDELLLACRREAYCQALKFMYEQADQLRLRTGSIALTSEARSALYLIQDIATSRIREVSSGHLPESFKVNEIEEMMTELKSLGL